MLSRIKQQFEVIQYQFYGNFYRSILMQTAFVDAFALAL